ncbi:MAG: cytochrome b/b6 domain-containing protein [Gammaproteobacteria bacterium]|nr:cytochrome b/b6 domain-containing protein [Gammaproteobacteria bacterium]
METKYWSLNTRLLHLGLVATITAQLFINLLMSEPDDTGTIIGKVAYNAHEIAGLTALGIIALHWAWSTISRSDGILKHLFPWKGDALNQVIDDIKLIFRGQPPISGKHGGLAGFVHGLGLLTITGTGITGEDYFCHLS